MHQHNGARPKAQRVDRLIFVYDGDAGMVNALIDTARKLLVVKGCALCSITHGLLGERGDWRSCREEIGVPVEGYHRDDVPGPLKELIKDRLPCVVAAGGGELRVLLGPAGLERCRGSVVDFKARLRLRAAMNEMVIPGWEDPSKVSPEAPPPEAPPPEAL